ncbi:MAG: hypothetical protein AB7G12_05825 [Thermoanaerobaculia bacterium]
MPALSPFALDLAGLTVSLEADSQEWSGVLERRYGAFRTGNEPRFRVRLEVRGEERSAAVLAPRLLTEATSIALANGRLLLVSASISGEVDLASGAGHLAGPLHRHGVDLLLRALLAATRPEALLLHGALVVDGSAAIACVGPSGAGKSTLARLLGGRAFCDELLLVRRGADGWQADALPFWHGRPGGGSLAAVHLLRHGDGHRLRRLDRGAALRRLAPEVVWPNFCGELAAGALARFEQLLAEVPVAELSFAPRADVWPVLRGVAA